MKNIPVFYNELKKNHNIVLTDTTWNALRESAKQLRISPSELIERLVREYCNIKNDKIS